MDTLSTSTTKELIETSHAQYRAMLKQMAPNRFKSWRWASEEFIEGAEWIHKHPHEIRTGIYLSDTPNKEVWRITIPNGISDCEVVIKYYLESTPSWTSIGNRSIAVNEALNYAALEGLGIPVAKLLACGEERKFGKLESSFIVTRFISNSIDGSALMPTGYLAEDIPLKLAFCRKALEIIARAHVCGFVHSAFHPNKILMDKNAPFDAQKLTLIDITRGGFNKALSMRAAIAIDLATFFIDLRLDAQNIEDLCDYYLKFNTTCGFSAESLWEAIIAVDFPISQA